MKRKVLAALLLGTVCLTIGCGKKEGKETEAKQASVVAETETKTESADETEAETAEETEAVSESGTEESETEAVSEADTEAETEEAIPRPEYQALDYVTLGEYKGLSVVVDPIVVTDEEIEDSIIGEVESQNKYEQKTEGTVAEGDTVNIDYEGKKDGVAFSGGTAQGADLTIGSNSFIDGFEDGLIGVNVGDTVDLNLTFPENYQSTELAGQDVVFTVTVNYIREMPAITDVLVSELSDGAYSTVEGYREYMRELLEQDKEADQEYAVYTELMTQLYNTCTIEEYPQELLDYSVDSMNKVYEQYAAMYGMELEDLIASFSLTQEDFDNMVLDNVKTNLQQELILKAIAEQEEMLLTEEEYAEGCADYAEQYGYDSAEEFEASYDRETIEISLLIDKMLLYVKDNAVIEEAEETEAVTEAVSEEAEDATEAVSEKTEDSTEAAAEEAETAVEMTESETEA